MGPSRVARAARRRDAYAAPVAAPLSPPELDDLVELAERSRVDDWSLRSALCRYAQPEPARVAAVLTLVRRWEAALHGHIPVLRRDGERYVAALRADGPERGTDDDTLDATLVGLLRVGTELDRIGEVAAAWAVDRTGDPGPELDAAAAQVAAELDRLGVPEEEPIPRGMRGRG